jgi:hypothetical protein
MDVNLVTYVAMATFPKPIEDILKFVLSCVNRLEYYPILYRHIMNISRLLYKR